MPRSRIAYSIALLVTIVLGLASRKYASNLPNFLADNAGDALWTVAIYLAIAIVFPKWPPLRIGLIAFAISVAVELGQLIDVGWLNSIRRTTLGSLLLGHGFLWVDLVRYFVGAVAATVLDRLWLKRKQWP
jgi:hypothetical protein